MASATSANHATSVAKMLVSNVVAAVVPFGISVGVATTLVSHVAVRRSSERRCVAALERSVSCFFLFLFCEIFVISIMRLITSTKRIQ